MSTEPGRLARNPIVTTPRLLYVTGLPRAGSTLLCQLLGLHPQIASSHYRYKYPHRTFTRIQPPAPHPVPARIARDLQLHFRDYYQTFYPGLLTDC